MNADELRQAGSLSSLFILFLLEEIISADGKNSIKDYHVPITYLNQLFFFFKENVCFIK